MRAQPTIRRCSAEDAPIIVDPGVRTFVLAYRDLNEPEYFSRYVAEAFSRETIDTELRRPGTVFLLAEMRTDAVGYAKLRTGPVPDCVAGAEPVELERIYSDPSYIGKGVGSALIQACLDEAKSASHDVVQSDTIMSRQTS